MRSPLLSRLGFALFATSMIVLDPVSALAQAAAPSAAAEPAPAQQSPAGKFIQDIGNQAISVMADKSMAQDQRSQKYRAILQSAFDMQTIGHFALGRAWDSASPQQRDEFMKLFEQTVLKTYGDRLSFYSGEGFRVTGERQESDKDTIVNSEVTHPNGAPPTKVDWRVRQGGDKPAIVDVVVAGVSQSITQRDEYASILQRNNGNIDALLAMMRKNAQAPSQQGGSSQAQ